MFYNYRVYLKTFDGSKIERILCTNLDEVEIVLENADKYFSYIVVKHDIKLDMDEVFDSGQIEHEINKRLVKSPKQN